jgi:hypothetical protein
VQWSALRRRWALSLSPTNSNLFWTGLFGLSMAPMLILIGILCGRNCQGFSIGGKFLGESEEISILPISQKKELARLV